MMTNIYYKRNGAHQDLAVSVVVSRGRNKASQVINQRNPCDKALKIGTWNIRTLLRAGKLENVKREMKKNGLCILGLIETKWKGEGDFMSEEVRVLYKGGNESQRGVAILLDKNIQKGLKYVSSINDRLLAIRISAKPVDLVIVQVYMPTSDHREEEID